LDRICRAVFSFANGALISGAVTELRSQGEIYQRRFACPCRSARQVLDDAWEITFRDWYQDFRTKPESEIKQAA
jgi:hypothetical protein